MIKKAILVIISLSFCACANNPQAVDPSINPADRHFWLPPDAEDFEKRRLRLIHFDKITKEIETLFLNLETTVPGETNMREGTKDSILEIESLEANRTNQIANEQKR
ncbi:uncharacterized protein METZ01_LOCUS456579, partial [marine metagenome]